MVILEPAPTMSVADDAMMKDRLAAELAKLLVGRSVVDAVALIELINEALAKGREAGIQLTVH